MEAFTTGSEGALVEWLQPYDGLSDSSLADVPRRLGLQRVARPCPAARPARTGAVLPWASDCAGIPTGMVQPVEWPSSLGNHLPGEVPDIATLKQR